MQTTAKDTITLITNTETDPALTSKSNDIDSLSKEENNAEIEKCLSMIMSLTEEEKEKAAQTSYKYLTKSTNASSNEGNDGNNNNNPTSKEERDKYAMAMARRHLVAEDGNETKALQKMQATIQYREQMKLNVIRQCFYKDESYFQPEDNYQSHRDKLSQNILEKKIFVRGYSKDKRAIFIVRTHLFEASGYDPDWFLRYNMYTLERAIACTERASDGELEKVIAIFDLGQYSNKVRTPMGLAKELTSCLADHYPERVEKILLVDAPFLFRAFYNLLYPFIDNDTRQKLAFVTGDNEKEEILGNIISKDQSMSFMQPGGELEADLDTKAYLYETPFDFTVEEKKD